MFNYGGIRAHILKTKRVQMSPISNQQIKTFVESRYTLKLFSLLSLCYLKIMFFNINYTYSNMLAAQMWFNEPYFKT